MGKSPADAEATMVANLKQKTGKSLDEWIKVVRSSKLAKHGEIVSMLKSDHAVGHGYANLVAHRALTEAAGGAPAEAQLVEAQYAGAKSGLKPLYEKLIAAVTAFGGDVEISPKKAYVGLRRNKQFGLIQPSTSTRLDVGINLKGVAPSGRLEASGSFNAMVSHRVRIEKPADVDKQVLGWLKQAYESA